MAGDTYSVLYENFKSQRCQSLSAFHSVPGVPNRVWGITEIDPCTVTAQLERSFRNVVDYIYLISYY